MKKLSLLLPVLLFILAFSLRFIGLANHAPFDWDQHRDYSQTLAISQGYHTALGPVAKGVGGFYLGSLYYYLLLPAFTLLGGSLTALPLTSIVLDALFAGLLYLLLASRFGKLDSLIIATLWSTSWFLIEASRVSWNVALVPLWSLILLYALFKLRSTHKQSALYLLALLFGLAFHIHATLIILFPFTLLFFLRDLRFSTKQYLFAILIALLPLTPLIHYDLTHSFNNLRLVKSFLAGHAASSTTMLEMIPMVTLKLGKVVRALFFAKFADSLILGITILALALSTFFRKRLLPRLASLLLLLNYLIIILFRDYQFPEYYFVASYLPILVIGVDSLSLLFNKLNLIWLLPFTILFLLLMSLKQYTTPPVAYSLGAKQSLVSSLSEIGRPLDVHLSFNSGREGGFEYLLARSNLALDHDSDMQVLLTDHVDGPVYIDGELCEDLTYLGNMKSAFHIVQ